MAAQSKKQSRVNVSVVLPAFNEEEGIAGVLEDIHKVLKGDGRTDGEDYEVVVVDDGSEDATAELAEDAGARVLRHPVNVGYGKSLLTGFAAARFDWILMLDADGSYPPEDLLKLLAYAPDIDMAIGARQGSFFWGSPLKAFGILGRIWRNPRSMLTAFIASRSWIVGPETSPTGAASERWHDSIWWRGGRGARPLGG